MSALHRELAALAADLRAVATRQAAVGARAEPRDAPAPEADPDAVVELAEDVADEAVEEEPPPPAAPPRASAAWDRVAVQARAERAPDHFDDGLGAAGLDRIRAELGDCTRCGLCRNRTNLVFGVGDPEADLMVIGEGPGEQEDLRGEPFVGPAGQMLDRMLENVIGLPRSQVYIANVVKCRPPDNRNPEPAEAATCKPFLFRQILAIQPRVVLVLGSVALKHVLDLEGIVRNRGRERAWRGIPVVPTFHPAYLLRKPEDKRLALEDLKLVKRRYDELGGRRLP
jgi:DNA polymerase